MNIPGYGTVSPAYFRMEVLRDVINERHRQEDLKAAGKFPATCADNTISDETKCAVLTEENGEVARVLCERACGKPGGSDDNLYEELVQVAAVAIAWCEALQYKRRSVACPVHGLPPGHASGGW
jgi:hypothetical protein